jgi:alpha-mannosidase
MKRWPELRFAHSTPALYAWMQHHRPALFAEIQAASQAGRWEPINGPWVETDCVLVSTASLWQQFSLGQQYSYDTFPTWTHHLAWLPDSFGFGAGLPAVAAATGVRWFCTHKLAWNAVNPFPHRLFRWRSRGNYEVNSLMLPRLVGGVIRWTCSRAAQLAGSNRSGLSSLDPWRWRPRWWSYGRNAGTNAALEFKSCGCIHAKWHGSPVLGGS